MKTISVNKDYREVVFEYTTEDGKTLPILFREWFNPPRIQAKFDDNFAVCNGYPDVATMVEQTVGLGTMLIMFGGVPDWIDVDRQGQFMFVGAYNNLNLN
mgnify:FL=1